jgi:hypothetical protein
MRSSAITMRELRKITAGAIRALEGPVAIKSGVAVIAMLCPIANRRQHPVKAPQHLVDEFERLAKQFDAITSPDERAL